MCVKVWPQVSLQGHNEKETDVAAGQIQTHCFPTNIQGILNVIPVENLSRENRRMYCRVSKVILYILSQKILPDHLYYKYCEIFD